MEDKTMKKTVFGIATLLLALSACNKIETIDQPVGMADGIPFSATVSLGDNAATKALAENGSTITASWAEGEKVALIHNGVSDEMTVSSVSGGSATISGTITGTPADGDAVTIIYPSSAADGTTGNIKADLLYAQNGLLTGEGSIAEKYDARKGTGTLKVDGTATLGGSVSLTNQFAIFKFTVRGADGTTVISAKPLTVTIGTQDYVITPAAATDVLYAALPAVSGEKVSFDATDGSDRTYTCAKLSVSFAAGSYYQSTLKMREYVDLGIVVGGKKIKWATCNVGAANPQDYGDYFAWGETTTKTDYKSDWSNYFDTSDGGFTFTKYNIDGGKTVLDLEDDAANANWGGSWRMPTNAEMNALLALSKEWVTYEGVNGYKFTGNGKTLFLPAAGFRLDTDLGYAGSRGYYWSSSLRGSDYAWRVYFDSGAARSSSYSRYYGQPVRPVTE
ncbi:MAG: DUF1566 domain-containing protein [Bacteroidales bacterium]|nr:DUF1566 domain-containing protein [Bacteroidales bacterium]